MKSFFSEFKTFIARGNMMDMAVGVIVGGAFKTIADSLTNDILMPLLSILLGVLLGGVSLADLVLTMGAVQITYGNFIQAILNFVIMAFAVFCLIKAVNAFHRKKEEAPAAPPAPPEPSAEEKLLMEIRDLLKEKS